MPNRRNRARKRQGGAGSLLIALILIFAALAAALVFLLTKSAPLTTGAERPSLYPTPTGLVFEDAGATHAPLTLGATATPEPTAGQPEPTPEPSDAIVSISAAPAASETASANRFMPTPQPGDYFLPVIDRALRTPDDQAMIAITLDGCDNVGKMTRILKTCEAYDAKLTLFPTGKALMSLGPGFRTSINTLGFELENTTFDADKKDYSLSTGELALQIWRQSLAASYAMERDFQQHFYRPSLPQSAGDQRTHFFIRKLGLSAVVTYTQSYKDNDLDSLVSSLANGNIYQFDMSEEAQALLEPFMSEANRKGYKMVTLNELLGMKANKQGRSLTLDKQTLPEFDDYVPSYYDLKLNDRSNAVYTLQARLMGLGYLTAGPDQNLVADGIYGSETSIAVSKFQARVGLIATGNADIATQEKLFSADAPAAQ